MVELASHVRVQKKDKKKKKEESMHHNPDWGVSTSNDESGDRLVPTYLSSMESGVTMRDSRGSLSDRRISDVPRRISDVPRQISDTSPTSDIADKFGSQIVLRTGKDA
jgi:hypothetical protein